MGVNASFSEQQNNQRVTEEIKIFICGAHKIGKSSLISRMKNISFDQQYHPTSSLAFYQFYWNPPQNISNIFKIQVYECPPNSISNNSQNENNSNISYEKIYSESDGIILIYDPDTSSSIQYIQSFIDDFSKTPFYSKKPILLISNFLDKRKNISYIPEFVSQLQKLNHLFIHIQTSFLTNRGLNHIIQWLDQPLLYISKNNYLKQLSEIQEQINNHEIQFQNEVISYEDQLKSIYPDYSDDIFIQQFEIQQKKSNPYNKVIHNIETKSFYNI